MPRYAKKGGKALPAQAAPAAEASAPASTSQNPVAEEGKSLPIHESASSAQAQSDCLPPEAPPENMVSNKASSLPATFSVAEHFAKLGRLIEYVEKRLEQGSLETERSSTSQTPAVSEASSSKALTAAAGRRTIKAAASRITVASQRVTQPPARPILAAGTVLQRCNAPAQPSNEASQDVADAAVLKAEQVVAELRACLTTFQGYTNDSASSETTDSSPAPGGAAAESSSSPKGKAKVPAVGPSNEDDWLKLSLKPPMSISEYLSTLYNRLPADIRVKVLAGYIAHTETSAARIDVLTQLGELCSGGSATQNHQDFEVEAEPILTKHLLYLDEQQRIINFRFVQLVQKSYLDVQHRLDIVRTPFSQSTTADPFPLPQESPAVQPLDLVATELQSFANITQSLWQEQRLVLEWLYKLRAAKRERSDSADTVIHWQASNAHAAP